MKILLTKNDTVLFIMLITVVNKNHEIEEVLVFILSLFSSLV